MKHTLVAVALLGFGIAGASAQAPSRVALVIGNAAYPDAPLRNPVNDAREVAAALRALGYSVTAQENLGLGRMRAALRKFVLATRAADVRLIYFAGHGLQMRGRSYLLPVDVKINNETDVLERTADATDLMAGLRNGKIVEHFNDFADRPVQAVGSPYPTVVDGYFSLPQGPGWGVELDYEFLESHPPERVDGIIQDPGLNMFVDSNWSKRGSHIRGSMED